MNDKNSLQKHPLELYRKLSLEAYKNAKRYIDEADLLYKRKSFGHSYALAVLGFEEWVKSIVGLLLLSGFLNQDDEDVQNCFQNHIFKHNFGLALILFFMLSDWLYKTKFKHEIDHLIIQFNKREISVRRFEIEIQNYIELDNSMEAENLKVINKNLKVLISDNRKIEDQKQNGLYVGVDFKNNQISTPDDLKNIRMDDTLLTYRIFIESTDPKMKELEKLNGHDKKIKAMYKEGKTIRDLVDKLNKKNELGNKNKQLF